MAKINDDAPENKESALSAAQPTLPLEWHFLQCFGQPNAAEAAPNADILSALKFNHTGEFLATGDKGGRIVLLQQTERTSQQQPRQDTLEDGRWMLPMEFHYLSEFQAHQPDFDYLKSIEIPEKINSISWLHNCGTTHMLLSANDKQVKLWKIYDRTVHNIANYNHGPNNGSGALAPNGTGTFGNIADGHMLRVPAIVGSSKSLEAKCKRSYDVNAHLYFINSVSMCPDQATFVSADDLTVHLWNLERFDGHQTILDMRPIDPDYAASVHVITSASFHPTNSDLLGYSSSKTALSVIDLRQKDLRGERAVNFADHPTNNSPTVNLAELVAAPTRFDFSNDGVHAVTRDYMHAALWDIRQPSQPVRVYQVHPHLWDRLNDVFDNECIFDRLGCAISPTGDHVVAGAYGELAVFNAVNDQFSLLKTCVQPFTMNGLQQRQDPFPVSYKWKVENVAWHPAHHLIVATSLNSLFTFCARPPSL